MIHLTTKDFSMPMAGFEIKKGWHANIDATCIHYNPTLYKDPMQFNPSRFDVLSSIADLSWEMLKCCEHYYLTMVIVICIYFSSSGNTKTI